MSRSAALLLCLLGCNVWKAVTKTLGAPEAAQGRCGKGGGTGPLCAAAPGAAGGVVLCGRRQIWEGGGGPGVWRGGAGGGAAAMRDLSRLRGSAGAPPAAVPPSGLSGEGSPAAAELLLTEGAGAAAGLIVQPPLRVAGAVALRPSPPVPPLPPLLPPCPLQGPTRR